MIIICIGDSLTYGYGVGRPQTWCALASRLTGHEFVNRGGGLFAMGGLNDLFLGRPVSVPLENFRTLCRHALDKGIRPTIGIPMQISPDVDEAWCDGPVDIAKVRASYAEFAEKLLEQCRSGGIRTIDFRPLILPEHLSFDGIHLSRAGHERMAEAVAAAWSSQR